MTKTDKFLRWLPVSSAQAVDLIQTEMAKQGIKFARLIGREVVMLITINKPYSFDGKEFDRVIYRKFTK